MKQLSQDTLCCCAKGGALLEILASRLAGNVRRHLGTDVLALGIPGSGSTLSDLVASELKVPTQKFAVRPVFYSAIGDGVSNGAAGDPALGTESDNIIGAVSGCTDVVYIDGEALDKFATTEDEVIALVQRTKLECVEEAVTKGITIAGENWSDRHVILVCCAHASSAVIEVALQKMKLRSPQKVSLVMPFLSSRIKRACRGRVNSIVSLKEFESDKSIFHSSDPQQVYASGAKPALECVTKIAP